MFSKYPHFPYQALNVAVTARQQLSSMISRRGNVVVPHGRWVTAGQTAADSPSRCRRNTVRRRGRRPLDRTATPSAYKEPATAAGDAATGAAVGVYGGSRMRRGEAETASTTVVSSRSNQPKAQD